MEKNDQIPVLAQLITHVYGEHLASLVGRGDIEKAQVFFKSALEKTQSISKEDPGNRALAITSNNLASVELFFGYEAPAHVEKVSGNEKAVSQSVALMTAEFEKLSAADRTWSEKFLLKLI